jgi:hypothetical protein
MGDVLTHAAVPSRRADPEQALLVAELDRHAVVLGLSRVADRLLALEHAADACVEGERLLDRGHVVERQHRDRVLHRAEPLGWLGAHALGGRVGGDAIGVPRLQLHQLAVQAVVVGVRDDRVVEHVVAVIVLSQLFLELA